MNKLVKFIAWAFAAGSIVLIAALFYVTAVMVPSLPPIDQLDETQLQVPLRVYDKNQILLAEFGEHRRIPVTFDEVPPHVIDAFIAAEDDQFFNHFGIDVIALAAAAYEVVTTGRKTRGGSTITMQVARNFFLSSEKTYTRKLNEILLALKIEGEFSKQTIMELYLNKIFLGHRAYGISAASQVYYDKKLEELSLAQAAMIAGLPKAPSKYNPVSNPERSLIRRDHILGRMYALGFIDEAQYDEAREEPVTAELHKTRNVADAQYVAEMVRSELFELYGEEIYGSGFRVYTTIDADLQVEANRSIRRALLDYSRRHGYRGPVDKINLEDIQELDPFDEDMVVDRRLGGLRKGVVTAIVEADEENPETVAAASVLISDYQTVEVPFVLGLEWASRYINEDKTGPEPEQVADVLSPGDVIWLEQRDGVWLLANLPTVEGALVSLNSSDGSIQALAGGFDYFKSKFNRAVQARRQPGSLFKPFIYSAALEKGYTAASVVNDAPVVFDDDSLEAAWRPENYSGKFYGPTRLREALVKSRNLVSIRVLQSIGLRYGFDYAKRFGFEEDQMQYDLSLALGSGSFSPMQIARGYAVFANGGYLVSPYLISRVEDSDGNVVFEHDPLRVCQSCDAVSEQLGSTEGEVQVLQYAPRIIDERNAHIMRSMMREVVERGTAVRAKALGRNDLGGKTGTTNDQIDAWFSGFNDQVVTTAWVGFDNYQTLGRRETGGRAALPMWINYMGSALANYPDTTISEPAGLVTVRIDSETGKRAALDSRNTRFEIFRSEFAPRENQAASISVGSSGTGVLQPLEPESEDEVVEDLF